MIMRAKFQISEVKLTQYGEVVAGAPVTGKGSFGPEGESEDNTYARFTPSGKLELTISNPALYGKIRPGQTFYVDFTDADADV